MGKIGRSKKLIAYDTDINIKRRQRGEAPEYRIVRPRTALYAVVIAVVAAVMLYALVTRRTESISVIHERNPMFVRLSDGAIRNAYVARIINKKAEPREFALSVTGLAGTFVDVVGATRRPGMSPVIEVGPDQTREVRVLVTDYDDSREHSTPIRFHILDVAGTERAQTSDHFWRPQ
jgi:polyferredoxin